MKTHFEGAYLCYEDKGTLVRSFYEDRALCYLFGRDDILGVNSYWWRKENKEDICIFVICNDVFAWGCADAEDLPYEEIENLYNMVKKDVNYGSTIWCIIQRKELPQKPVFERIQKEGIWDLHQLQKEYNLEENRYDKFCYERYLEKQFSESMSTRNNEWS